jgi:hypothetical protein
MPRESRQPQGTTGVIHIVSESRIRGQSRASHFAVSFGGEKDGVGAFLLGRATGFDPLTALLQKLGISRAEVDTAVQVLMAQPHHEIQNVTLTPALIRELGL